MEPLHYQPEDDPIDHLITAEVALEEGSGITFRVKSDGNEICEIDVEVCSSRLGFISGVGQGEKANNGYLGLASLAVSACLHEGFGYRFQELVLYDIDDRPIV